jgi:signal transduction histidine kinase
VLVEWRNWKLAVKLAAVLVVPVVVAVTVCVLQITGDVGRANSYAGVQRLVGLRAGLMPLMAAVQQERSVATHRLGAGGGDPSTFQQQAHSVDNAVTAVTSATSQTTNLNDAARTRYVDLVKLLDGLPSLRQQVLSSSTDVAKAAAQYGDVVKGLLDYDQALMSQFGDPALTGTAAALYDLEVAQEQVYVQHAVLLAGIARGRLLSAELKPLQDADIRFQDKLGDFQAVATATQQHSYQQAVAVPEFSQRTQLEQLALSRGAQDRPAAKGQQDISPGVSAADWTRTSETTTKLMANVENDLAGQLAARAASLQDATSNAAGAASVVLLSTLVIAGAFGLVLGRYMLRSFGTLRRSAIDIERRLPDTVQNILEGETQDLTVDPLPVHTTEEFGQLARAFDALHGQAVRSAVEQAGLRNNFRNIFVNLSRRSQSLVERQLRLMEQLERHEENPEQLANLFKLDHLATRMRRNNENLMVLSGNELTRRFRRPVPLGDVLRAAVSEIENYERTVVRSAPTADVLGYTAGDLVRLLAELLDNATAFSPPETQVVISSHLRRDRSVVIEILDQGIGMRDTDLAEFNRQLAVENTAEVPASRQMGLFVVGRLASRHSIDVRLSQNQSPNGLRVSVRVPPDVVKTTSGTLAEFADFLDDAPLEVPAMAAPHSTRNGTSAAALLPNSASIFDSDRPATSDQAPHDVSGTSRGPERRDRQSRQAPPSIPNLPAQSTPSAGINEETLQMPPSLSASRRPAPMDKASSVADTADVPIFDDVAASTWFDSSKPAQAHAAEDPSPERGETPPAQPTWSSFQPAEQPTFDAPPAPHQRASEQGHFAAEQAASGAPAWTQSDDTSIFPWFDGENSPSADQPSPRVPHTPPGPAARPPAENRDLSSAEPGSLPKRVRHQSDLPLRPQRSSSPSPSQPPSPSTSQPPSPSTSRSPSSLSVGPELSGQMPGGLPKRTPRANLAPSLAEKPSAPEVKKPVNRNPDRIRGFLSNYQAGTRHVRNDSAQKPTDDGYGQENL